MPKDVKASSAKKTSKSEAKKPAEVKRVLPQASMSVRSFDFTRSLTWDDIIAEEETRGQRVKDAEEKRKLEEELKKKAAEKKEQKDKPLIVEETDKKKKVPVQQPAVNKKEGAEKPAEEKKSLEKPEEQKKEDMKLSSEDKKEIVQPQENGQSEQLQPEQVQDTDQQVPVEQQKELQPPQQLPQAVPQQLPQTVPQQLPQEVKRPDELQQAVQKPEETKQVQQEAKKPEESKQLQQEKEVEEKVEKKAEEQQEPEKGAGEKKPYSLPPAFLRTARWSSDERLDQKPYLEIAVTSPGTTPGKKLDEKAAEGQTTVALDFTARAPGNELQRAHVNVGFHPAEGVKVNVSEALKKRLDYPGELREDTAELEKATVRRRFPVQTPKLRAAIDVMDKYDTGMPYNFLFNNSNTFAANLAKQAAIPGIKSVFPERELNSGRKRAAPKGVGTEPKHFDKERRALEKQLEKAPPRPGESDADRAARQQEELDRYERSLSRKSDGGTVKTVVAADIAQNLLKLEDKGSTLITDKQLNEPENDVEAEKQKKKQIASVNRLKDFRLTRSFRHCRCPRPSRRT